MYIYLYTPHNNPVSTISFPYFTGEETNAQKVKEHAQCHTGKNWWSQNLNLKHLASELLLLIFMAYFPTC